MSNNNYNVLHAGLGKPDGSKPAGRSPPLKGSSGTLLAHHKHKKPYYSHEPAEEQEYVIEEERNWMDTFRAKLEDAWESFLIKYRRNTVKGMSSYPSNVSIADLGKDGLPCSHKDAHCVLYQFKGLMRGLAVGYGMYAGWTLLLSAFSRKIFKSPGRVIVNSVVNAEAVRFAKFLGTMGFSYRIMQCLLCKLRGGPSRGNSAAAAFLAGSAIMLDSPDRRRTIAIYLVCRGLYEYVRTLIYMKRVQERKHATEISFALCQIPIMYAFVCQPAALSRSYHRWILGMANMSAEQVRHIMTKDFRPCQPVYHTGSCLTYNFEDFLHGIFVRAVPIYAPVHLVPALLFKRKYVMRNPIVFLAEAAVAILRSSVFLGSYTAMLKSLICLFRNQLQYNSQMVPILGGLMTGFALLAENSHRHIELLMYVMPRALETTVNLCKAHLPKWLAHLNDYGHLDALLFMIATSMFVYCADTPPKLRGINATVFRVIFGSGTRMIRIVKKSAPARRTRDTVEEGDEQEDAPSRNATLRQR